MIFIHSTKFAQGFLSPRKHRVHKTTMLYEEPALNSAVDIDVLVQANGRVLSTKLSVFTLSSRCTEYSVPAA